VPDARIVTICSYYDERPQWLGEHLASLAPITDHFVYVDGAYALFPGAFDRPNSPLECAEAVESMGRACGRPVLHYRPTRPFYGNEVEKRNMSLDLARSIPGVIGDPNVWFLVADADTVAIKCNDAIPRILGETDRNVASFGYQQSHLMDLLGTPLPQDPDYGGGRWQLVRRAEQAKKLYVKSVYRNLPGLRYGPAHWHVSHGLPGHERSWLWGGVRTNSPLQHEWAVRPEPCLDLTYDLFFEHRRRYREPDRNDDAARYYEIRDFANVEGPNNDGTYGTPPEFLQD
jgi:hypothetical protein